MIINRQGVFIILCNRFPITILGSGWFEEVFSEKGQVVFSTNGWVLYHASFSGMWWWG